MNIMKKKKIISLLIGIAIGFLIWEFSHIFTGEIEPWDAEKNSKYYFIALFLAGFFVSMPYPNQYLMVVLGIFLGQICFLKLFQYGPLFGVGILMIAFYTLVALLGAFFANRLRLGANRNKRID